MPPRAAIAFAAAQILAALSLVAALAACQSAPDETGAEAPPSETSAAPAGPAAPVTDAVAPPVNPLGLEPPGLVIETGAAPGTLAALPPEPVIDDDPQQLYGLDSRALGEVLGEPSLIRREAPAEIWQYRSQTCVFDVFLYDQAGGARVSYIEARDDAAERIDARGCLNELMRARMGLPLG